MSISRRRWLGIFPAILAGFGLSSISPPIKAQASQKFEITGYGLGLPLKNGKIDWAEVADLGSKHVAKVSKNDKAAMAKFWQKFNEVKGNLPSPRTAQVVVVVFLTKSRNVEIHF